MAKSISYNKGHYLKILVDYCVNTQCRLMQKSKFWESQIDDVTPPVLWFGDLSDIDEENRKPIVLTIGFNPSWREYHTDKTGRTLLSRANKRLFECPSTCKNCISSHSCPCIQNMEDGYNNYFKRNPYEWFGHWKNGAPYNVECFVNGLGATFYAAKQSNFKYRAVHVDLFPFATMDGYSKISAQVDNDIFASGFSKRVLSVLICLIAPELIVLTDKGVYDKMKECIFPCMPTVFDDHDSKSIGICGNNVRVCATECAKIMFMNKYPTIAVRPNLGNPRGYTKDELSALGRMASKL